MRFEPLVVLYTLKYSVDHIFFKSLFSLYHLRELFAFVRKYPDAMLEFHKTGSLEN